jgi:vacuolar-type H+-ATPase subunit H
MKEIVERILKEERLAQDRIEKARKDSEIAVQKARKEAQDMVVRSSNDAIAAVDRKKLESQQEFIRQKQEALKKTQDEVAASVSSLSKSIPAEAEKIFTKIMSIED